MSMVDRMQYPNSRILALIARVAKGSRHNFAIRVSDWFASSVVLSFGLVLTRFPQVMDGNPWYRLLEQHAPAQTWGLVCAAIGLARVGALTVNGTFPAFRWSPHLRFLMALMSCFVWFQITLGLIEAQAPTMAIAMFPHMLLFDLYNVFLASSEAGVVEGQHRDARN